MTQFCDGFGHSCKLVYSKSHDGVTWLCNLHTTDVKQLCGSWEACFWHLIACWSMIKQVWRLWCLYVWAVVNSLRMQMKSSGRWLRGNNRAVVPCRHEGRKQASHEMLLQCRLWRQCLYLLLLPSPSHIVPAFAFLGGRYMLMQRRKFKARNSEDHANVTTNRAPKWVLLKLNHEPNRLLMLPLQLCLHERDSGMRGLQLLLLQWSYRCLATDSCH